MINGFGTPQGPQHRKSQTFTTAVQPFLGCKFGSVPVHGLWSSSRLVYWIVGNPRINLWLWAWRRWSGPQPTNHKYWGHAIYKGSHYIGTLTTDSTCVLWWPFLQHWHWCTLRDFSRSRPYSRSGFDGSLRSVAFMIHNIILTFVSIVPQLEPVFVKHCATFVGG